MKAAHAVLWGKLAVRIYTVLIYVPDIKKYNPITNIMYFVNQICQSFMTMLVFSVQTKHTKYIYLSVITISIEQLLQFWLQAYTDRTADHSPGG